MNLDSVFEICASADAGSPPSNRRHSRLSMRLSSCSEILPNKVDRRCSGSSPLTVGTRLLAVGVVAVFLTSAQVWCLNIGPKQQTASQPDRSGVREQRPASEQSTQL